MKLLLTTLLVFVFIGCKEKETINDKKPSKAVYIAQCFDGIGVTTFIDGFPVRYDSLTYFRDAIKNMVIEMWVGVEDSAEYFFSHDYGGKWIRLDSASSGFSDTFTLKQQP